MAGFLIYMPGVEAVGAADLRAVGLCGLDQGRGPASLAIDCGPDGKPGALAFWPDRRTQVSPVSYDAGSQRWQPAKPDPINNLPAGRFWMGVYLDKPPDPKQLERRRQTPGREVVLGDGNQWRIPRARSLPTTIGIGDDGTLRTGPPIDDALDRIVDRIFGWLGCNDGNVEVPPLDGFEAASKFLSINYRLERNTIDFLGLLNTPTAIRDVCEAVVEFDELCVAAVAHQCKQENADG